METPRPQKTATAPLSKVADRVFSEFMEFIYTYQSEKGVHGKRLERGGLLFFFFFKIFEEPSV